MPESGRGSCEREVKVFPSGRGRNKIRYLIAAHRSGPFSDPAMAIDIQDAGHI